MKVRNFFSFCFRGQEKGEAILALLRRHWFNVLVQFIPVLLLAGVLFASLFYSSSITNILNNSAFQTFFYFLQSLLAMYLCVFSFLIWVDFYLDTWIITDKRIINIEQKGLFSRVNSELALDKIQDVTTDVTGLFPTLLNYGDVFVQTAAEKERFIFRKVPNPYKIKDLLMKLQKEKEKEKDQKLEHMLHEELG
jgi:uncharacterized membrane protein YdbT with pleckstrin-like domain